MKIDFLQPLLSALVLFAIPVACLVADKRDERRVRAAAGKLDGILALLGYFSFLLSLLLILVSCWSAGRLYYISRAWHTADAEVIGSEVISDWVWNDGGRLGSRMIEVHQARCVFRYTVDDQEYVVAVEGFSDRSEDYAERLVDLYSPGSKHVIHYRPSDPRTIGMVGGSGEIVRSEADKAARLALILAGIGCPPILAAHLIVNRRKRAMSAT